MRNGGLEAADLLCVPFVPGNALSLLEPGFVGMSDVVYITAFRINIFVVLTLQKKKLPLVRIRHFEKVGECFVCYSFISVLI